MIIAHTRSIVSRSRPSVAAPLKNSSAYAARCLAGRFLESDFRSPSAVASGIPANTAQTFTTSSW
jgi:hypothetical protein